MRHLTTLANGLLAIAVLTALMWVPAHADEATFSGTYTDDGGCVDAGIALSAEYRHSDKPAARDITAYVRQAPSGGDCTQDALTYSFSAEQNFDGWLVKVLADSRSTAANYGLGDGMGSVIARADGRPYFPTRLPAGRADTVAAILGYSVPFGGCEIDLGGNIVAVDWADGSTGQTAHVGLSCERGRVSVRLDADTGNDTFGDAVVSYTHGILRASVRYAFGLTAVDGGEPAMQDVGGAPFHLLGAPEDTSLVFEVGFNLTI